MDSGVPIESNLEHGPNKDARSIASTPTRLPRASCSPELCNNNQKSGIRNHVRSPHSDPIYPRDFVLRNTALLSTHSFPSMRRTPWARLHDRVSPEHCPLRLFSAVSIASWYLLATAHSCCPVEPRQTLVRCLSRQHTARLCSIRLLRLYLKLQTNVWYY